MGYMGYTDIQACRIHNTLFYVYLSMAVVVVRLVPSSESVKARKGEGRGDPTVFISNSVVSIPYSESASVTEIGIVCGAL